jgi:diketogulonate reductase-like aldo/keto reductase
MATIGTLPLGAAKRTATDTAVLGRSNMEVTRLAFGTGTDGGAVQAALGQQEFTRLVRYAYDHGIRFFETAEAYQTPGMLGEALKGLPRDSYHLMNKVTTFHEGIDPQAKFDELLRTSQTEYFDIMLLAAHGRLAGDHEALAGRDTWGAAEEDHSYARRLSARATGAATDAGYKVARRGTDPHQSQWRAHGRADL